MGTGSRVVLPEGKSMSQHLRDLIEQAEQNKATTAMLRETMGMDYGTYRYGRDIIRLDQMSGRLSPSEKTLVKKALGILDQTRQVRNAYKLVKAIATRVWKTGQRRDKIKFNSLKADQFFDRLIPLTEGCGMAAELKIPVLTKEEHKRALKEIRYAITAIVELETRLKKESTNVRPNKARRRKAATNGPGRPQEQRDGLVKGQATVKQMGAVSAPI